MDRMRCFIAVELSEEIKSALRLLEAKLKKGRHKSVKWVDPENMHLTLKFLGAAPVESMTDIVNAMTRLAAETSSFALDVGGLGCFPNWQRPQVIWVGIGGEIRKLTDLQRDLDAAMHSLGFARELRGFVPHLTLARVREGTSLQEKQTFGQWANSVEFAGSLELEVSGLSLMESRLTQAGPIYTRLATAELI